MDEARLKEIETRAHARSGGGSHYQWSGEWRLNCMAEDDIRALIAEVRRLRGFERELAKARKDAAAKQAQIDALMFEYCPDEMTDEQRTNWAKHLIATRDDPLT